MRSILCLLVLVSSLASASTLIRGVTVVSPERTKPLADAWVLVDNDRVKSIGTGEAPAADTVVDGKGGFLIPGLIDSHVHLAGVPGMALPQNRDNPAIVEAYRKQLPRSYLYFGYTGLVDLNVAEREPLDAFKKEAFAPDLFDCDGALIYANGYPMNYIPAEHRFEVFRNFIYDPRQKGKIPPQYKASEHSPKAAVARVKAAGASCVKVFYEPGWMPGDKLPTPTKSTLVDIKNEAHKVGLPVLVHANSFDAQKFALQGKPDIFVHGMWNWGKYEGKKGLPPEIKKVLDTVVAEKIGYQPTFQVMQGLKTLFDDGYLDRPEATIVGTPGLIGWLKSKPGQWFKDDIRADWKKPFPELIARYDEALDQLNRVVKYLDDKKARLLFGSDTPSAPTFGNMPGWNGYLEMKHWNAAGVKLDRILHAATLANAEAFKIEKDFGSIESGKIANLVLLDKNPLETVEAYDSIRTVFLHGKAIRRDELKSVSATP